MRTMPFMPFDPVVSAASARRSAPWLSLDTDDLRADLDALEEACRVLAEEEALLLLGHKVGVLSDRVDCLGVRHEVVEPGPIRRPHQLLGPDRLLETRKAAEVIRE